MATQTTNVDATALRADATAKANAAQAAAIAAASSDATTKANAAQAFAIQRANHTGTQLASTISDFDTAALAAAPAETTTTTGALINGATAKTTPVDADFVGLMDSAASNILKKLSWANIKATLKAYFDTLYSLSVVTIRTYTGTTDTLVLTDAGNWVRGNNASPNVMTVPTNAVVAFPVGSQVSGSQYGAGQMSIAAAGGVTINSAGGALKLAQRYSPYLLTKTGTDEWHLSGDITT